jgi:hypothetical protein
MLRAMIAKELRETFWIALVALGVYLLFTVERMGYNLESMVYIERHWIPFASGEFTPMLGWVSACLALALGFRQSIWESFRGTWPVLLHRPVSRRWVVGVKVAAGLALYLATAAMPILLYAAWAATPGTHASPFEWSMTLGAWRVWLAITGFYLAAFLVGIRPARWFGSRLLPLVGAGMLVLLVLFLPWWQWSIIGALVLDACLISTIVFVAYSRDYS